MQYETGFCVSALKDTEEAGHDALCFRNTYSRSDTLLQHPRKINALHLLQGIGHQPSPP